MGRPGTRRGRGRIVRWQTGELESDIAFPLPAKIIAEMLGVPAEDWDIFQRWARFGGGRENEGNRHQPKPRMSPCWSERGKMKAPVIPSFPFRCALGLRLRAGSERRISRPVASDPWLCSG